MLLRDILWTYTVFVLSLCVFLIIYLHQYFFIQHFFSNKNRPDSWILPTIDSSHHGLKSLKSLQLKMHCCSRTSPKPLKSIPSTAYIPEMQDMSLRNPFIHTASQRASNICVALNKNYPRLDDDASTFQVAKFGKLLFGPNMHPKSSHFFAIAAFWLVWS